MMEMALPGSAYVYQGEELGLFEVADIPWDELEDPSAWRTSRSASTKGRDGCRVPLPWVAADAPQLDDPNDEFGHGGSFDSRRQTRRPSRICRNPSGTRISRSMSNRPTRIPC